MPTYTFECDRCKRSFDEIWPIDLKPWGKACVFCGILNITAFPIITHAPSFRIDKGRHYSPAFGREFKSEKDLRDYAKSEGYIPVENASVESVEKASKAIQDQKQNEFYKSLAEPIEWSDHG